MSGEAFSFVVGSLSRRNVGRGSPETATWAFVRDVEFAEEKTLAIPTGASSFEGFSRFPNGEGRWATITTTQAAVSLTGVMGLKGGCLEEH